MDIQVGGIVGFLVFVGDIWAIINILGSRGEPLNKLLWILVVIFLPVLGLIVWFFAGPRSSRL